MKSKITVFIASALIIFAISRTVPAQSNQEEKAFLTEPQPTKKVTDLATEVEELKRRISDLETQNREMFQVLKGLKSQLEKDSPAETHLASSSNSKADLSVPQKPTKENPPADDKYVKWNEVTAAGSKIKLYGFLRLDISADSQRPNNPQAPQFVVSPDAAGNKSGAGNISFYSKFTRLGIDFTGPRLASLGDALLTGKYEMDFFGSGGTESRPIARKRFAWLKLSWERLSLTMGQDWDFVSPLLPTPNQHADMNYVGNTGDRRPQVKVEWKQKAGAGMWTLQSSIGLTGAIDQEDLDNDGYRDGEESGRPAIQGRIAYSHSGWVKDKLFTIGFGDFYGFEKINKAIGGRTNFHPHLMALDYAAPISNRLDFRGEIWWGKHLSDVRGGISQNINPVSGNEIRARGGWTELKLTPNRFYSLHTGFTIDDPVDRDLLAGGRTRNRTGYLGTRIVPVSNFMMGFDFLRWQTNYKGQQPGIDNRINLIFQYSF